MVKGDSRLVTGWIFGVVVLLGLFTPFPSLEWGWITLAALLFLTREDYANACRRPFLFCFLGLGLLSTLWSREPRTLEASLVLLADAWLGLALARRATSEEIVRGLAVVFLIFVAINLAGVFFLPPDLAFNLGGEWRGYMTHENSLGRTCALALVLALCAPGPTLAPLLRIPLAVLSGLLLWESTALAPMVGCAVCLGATALYRLSRRLGRPAVLVVCLGWLVALACLWEPLLDMLGRTPALNGRVLIWSASTRYASESIWWGHGLAQSEPTWFANLLHPHQGLLSLLVQLGLLGAAFFLLDGLGIVLRWVRGRGRISFRAGAALLFLLYYLTLNLAEVYPPHGGHFSAFLLYVAATQQLLDDCPPAG